MSGQSWWQRTIAVINREYERRIRRASLVTEYGADHHGLDHGDHAEAPPEHDDGEVAAIMNVPKGTRIGRHAPLDPSSDRDPPAA